MNWHSETLVRENSYVFNSNDNSGEAFELTTSLYSDNKGHTFPRHKLTLYSYGNCIEIHLYGNVITPEKLRKLADQLEYLLDPL